jgi:signal transduction histidine kinase
MATPSPPSHGPTSLGRPLPRDARLVAYVVTGALVGLAYVAFDVLSESRIEQGTLTGALASLHAVVDRAGPVVVGAMLGVFVHYLSLRRELSLAEAAASRAEALRTRLLKVERDQAVWVLAAAVLHELNNPLHALGLLLDEHAAEKDEARRAELLERARAHADRARLKLAMLRTLRGSAEPDLGRVALGGLVSALADDMGSLAAEDGVAVRADCDPDVLASADSTYVRTILESLVDNSLSSLRAGGGKQITIRLAAEDGRAVVRVADDGPPIDEEARKDLFEPLRSTKTQGLGLGLPIARALARAMRGELSLDEADPKAFRLELPLHPAEPLPSPAALQEEGVP